MVKATYADTTTRVRTTFGDMEEFGIGVGLHQRSALSPFLFMLNLDTLTGGIRTSAPCELIFTDDIILIGKMEEELKEKLVMWQRELASGGLRMSA